jgi:hypothetical protein
MRKFSVQSLPVRPGVTREDLLPASDPNTAETWRLGLMEPVNDQVEIVPTSDGDGGASTTSGPPDPPPDPDPDKK